mmetsp:Transcript_17070/g.35536  ORF Transcript_17070/g.35536 Transcript_17070/m.35536 type:complete len:309 (-) Transcript_17070:148-1074(-)
MADSAGEEPIARREVELDEEQLRIQLEEHTERILRLRRGEGREERGADAGLDHTLRRSRPQSHSPQQLRAEWLFAMVGTPGFRLVVSAVLLVAVVGAGAILLLVASTFVRGLSAAPWVVGLVALTAGVRVIYGLIGGTPGEELAARDGRRRSRVHPSERVAYMRTAQRLALVDRDFTSFDYEALLELDNNNQRLRMFLEGASQGTIDRLPSYSFKGRTADEAKLLDDCNYSSKPMDGRSETAESCSICLLHFHEGQEVRILPCLHQFHSACVDRWLVQQAKCPVCKLTIQGFTEVDDPSVLLLREEPQ